MRAAYASRYGSPDVLSVVDVPEPQLAAEDLLIRVKASAITQGDRRMRAADFGVMMAVPGRLFIGVWGPRFRVPGTSFAGEVLDVGASVRGFRPGDAVFGLNLHGAHAELLRMPSSGGVAPLPAGVGMAEAASLAYGAATALHFLRDVARVQAGEHVVVVGAAGGVGRSAVQLAAALGARVTGVCRPDQAELVEGLGGRPVVLADGRTGDGWAQGPVDVVFDTTGSARIRGWRRHLAPGGRLVFTDTTFVRLAAMACFAVGIGPLVRVGLAPDRRDLLDEVAAHVAAGRLRPVVAETFALGDIVAAHRCVEAERPAGDVVVVMG